MGPCPLTAGVCADWGWGCYYGVKKNCKPSRNRLTSNKENILTNRAPVAGEEGDCPIIKDLSNPHKQLS